MSDEIKEIRPILDKTVERVSPAIDILSGKAVVGVWLPSIVKTLHGKKEVTETKSVPFFVTEDRKLIPLVGELPFVLSSEPVEIEQRWKTEHINDFIDKGEMPAVSDVFENTLIEWKRYFVFLDVREYLFRTIWTIGTYFTHLFNTTIYDYVGGIKKTGKTKVLQLYNMLCFNAILSGNMSSSSLYRLVQNARATLLLDETEYLHSKDRILDFRNLLLFGYKAGSNVYRVEKVGRERLLVQQFGVFGPKALANIQGLEDVLQDRTKVTIMQRALSPETRREIDSSNPNWTILRNKYYRTYLGYWKEVKGAYNEIGSLIENIDSVDYVSKVQGDLKEVYNTIKDMNARELEIWHPMLALALFFDKKLKEESKIARNGDGYVFTKVDISTSETLCSLMAQLAKENEGIKATEDLTETGEYILLKVLLERIATPGYYRVKDIRDWMTVYFDEPQMWLTTRWIGNALRRFGFFEKRRLGTGYDYYISPDVVADRAQRLRVVSEQTAEPEKEGIEVQQKLLGLQPTAKQKPVPVQTEWISCEFLGDSSTFEEENIHFGPFTKGQVAFLPPHAAVRLARLKAVKLQSVDQATRNRLIDITITDLEYEHGGLAPKEEVILAIAAMYGEGHARNYVEQALQRGVLFEPKPNFVARVKSR